MKLIIRILVFGYGIFSFGKTVTYADDRIYQVKVVEEVLDNPLTRGYQEFEIDPRPSINTNNLSEDERINMCIKASSEVRRKEGIHVKLVENGKTEPKRSYALNGLESASKGEKFEIIEIVDAFKCPTKPATYLQVVEDKNKKEIVIVIVPLADMRVTDNIPIDDIQYELKSVSSVSEAVQRDIRLYFDLKEAVDSDQFTEGECIRMCEVALNTFPGRNIKWSRNDESEDVKFYKLKRRNASDEIEVVQAFQCPTLPRVFVTMPRKHGRKYVAWLIIIEEKEKYVPKSVPSGNISYEYELKVVQNIVDITLVSSRDARMSSVVRSAIDTDKLPEKDRLEMCRKGLRVVEYDYRFITFLQRRQTEPSKYYALHSEIGEDTVDIELVEAFKCPTKPALYIHVHHEQAGQGGLIWVIIKERRADFGFDSAVYSMQSVKDIHEASTGKIMRNQSEVSAIDTDDFKEDERRQMCRKAIKMVSGKDVEYLEDTETGLSKLYTIEVKKSKKTNDSADSETKRELVRAFVCPTEPTIHLEVQVDWDFQRYSIRVLIKEEDLDAKCDDTCYQIKYADKITEYSKQDANVFRIPQGNAVNTDDFTEEKRMEMCEKALEIDGLKNKEIKFIPKRKTGPQTRYVLELREAGRRDDPELVDAFKCPTRPTLYLQVLEKKDKKQMVWVIFNENEPDEVRFTEEGIDDPRFEFCRRALGMSSAENIPEGAEKGKYILFGLEVGGSEMDHIKGKNVLKAFTCPTKPKLRLELRRNDDDDDGIPIARALWRARGLQKPIVREINYKEKYADQVEKADSRDKAKFIEDVAEFPENERLHMCKDAIKKIRKTYNVTLQGDKPVGKTQEYILFSKGRSQEHVKAFRCPTMPTIYLEVVEDEDDAYLVWIIIEQEKSTPVRYDDVQYEVQYVAEIGEASPREINAFQKQNELAPLDEEKFPEEVRLQMCENAAKEVPGRPVKFKDQSVGESKYYYIRRADFPMSKRSGRFKVIKAFECPTRPEIYLQVEEEENELLVSVIIKRIPPLRYGVRAYKLKPVRSIRDAEDENQSEYEVEIFLPPEELAYEKEDRILMCRHAADIIPNGNLLLEWSNNAPGEEQFYTIEVEYENYVSQEIVSAFECPTKPPFYLQTFMDKYSSRSVWVIVERDKFA